MYKTGQLDIADARTTRPLRMVGLVSLFAFALAAAWAAPVTIDGKDLSAKVAFAGKGNSGGNGNGNGKDGAPGQQKQLVDEGASSADEDAVTSVAEGEGPGMEQPTVLPIAEDADPAATKVVKELAGIPEESALSEEEEMEAIRSGWGTWRTADGPETVIAQ